MAAAAAAPATAGAGAGACAQSKKLVSHAHSCTEFLRFACTGPEGEQRFQVKKWIPIGMWSWDNDQENCAICRNSLYEPSIDHQALGVSEVTISWGTCNHCFHLECIQRWLKTRNVCPLCGREWEHQKIQKVA